MGQCYSVYGSFIYSDRDKFCQTIRDEIEKRHNKSACFDLSRGNLFEPMGCIKTLVGNAENDVYGEEDEWDCSFNASYGWFSVMLEIFYEAFRSLENGSELTIYPDSGFLKIRKENGFVFEEFEEEQDK